MHFVILPAFSLLSAQLKVYFGINFPGSFVVPAYARFLFLFLRLTFFSLAFDTTLGVNAPSIASAESAPPVPAVRVGAGV